ncbi:29711_t:CDS:2, partial [Racocetra persica]
MSSEYRKELIKAGIVNFWNRKNVSKGVGTLSCLQQLDSKLDLKLHEKQFKIINSPEIIEFWKRKNEGSYRKPLDKHTRKENKDLSSLHLAQLQNKDDNNEEEFSTKYDEDNNDEHNKDEDDKDECNKDEDDKDEYNKDEDDKDKYNKVEDDKDEYNKVEDNKDEADKDEADRDEADKDKDVFFSIVMDNKTLINNLISDEDAKIVERYKLDTIDEVKIIKQDISNVIYLLFDEVEQIIKNNEKNEAIVLLAKNLASVDLPVSESAFDNLFTREICSWVSAICHNKGRLITLRACVEQKCDFQGTLKHIINKLEVVTGLRSGGLLEPHCKKIFLNSLDLAITMRDILYIFFESNANFPDKDLHKLFVLRLQSW